jgi:phytoene synthase
MAHSVKSYTHAREVTRREAKNFYYAFRLLDAPRQNAIYAVYAFSRRADDAVDSVEEKNISEEEARSKLAGLERLLRGEAPEDPLSPALLDTIERFKIPVQHFSELLLGMEMDLEKKRYETFDELYSYCFRAAAAVGLICIEIFGYSEEAAHQHAEELGIAMQLTNILRDVKEDMTRGRIYLPGEDLRRFNYSEAELSNYEFTPAFRELMEFQVERAREYFQRSEALFPLIDTETRYCPVLLKRLYSKILDRIELQGYDVFSRRPALSRFQKICMLLAATRDARKARRAASKK